MGFYLRSTVTSGPFRFTFSRAGIGMSAGVRGLRVGTGPRGGYVRVGSGGLSYRMSLPARASRPASAARPPAPAPQAAAVLTPLPTGNVLRMVDTSSAALLDEINRRQRTIPIARWVAGAGTAAALFALATAGYAAALVVSLLAAAAWAVAWQRDAAARTVVLMYDLDPAAEAAYDGLHRAFAAMAAAQGRWVVSAQGSTRDWKRNAGASTIVARTPVLLSTAPPGNVRTNVAVPMIPAGAHTLYFFPDRVLVYGRDGVGAVPYGRLWIRFVPTRFIESGIVPRDATVVDHTWAYVNRSGGPDRRFRDNRQIPVALYDEIQLYSDSGLNVVLQLSRLGTGEHLRAAIGQLADVASAPGGRQAT